ncbi:tumor necrosis factor ligand superfamily member 4-like [Lissotriton helveticus]
MEEESRSGQCTCCQSFSRRAHGGHRLLLVSTTAQWLLILACLVYMGAHFPRAQETKEDILYTESELMEGEPGEPRKLIWRFGKNNIENHSVNITKDGCYLICVRGSLESEGDKTDIKAYRNRKGEKPELILEEQMTNTVMNLLTLQTFYKGDTMNVTVGSEAKLGILSLKLTFLLEIPLDEADPTP